MHSTSGCCLFALLSALALAPIRAQRALGPDLSPLPSSGVTCTAQEATPDLRRVGPWQILQLQIKPGSRTLMLGLDARQRPLMLSASPANALLVLFDSNGKAYDLSPLLPGEKPLTTLQLTQAAALAEDSKRRCSPLPPIVAPGQLLPPALRTPVLGDIQPNDPKCRDLPITQADRQRGIAKSVLFTVAQPTRRFAVAWDVAGRPISFSASVSWSGQSPTTESAGVEFKADGSTSRATRTLLDPAIAGQGRSYPLSAAEIVRVRVLAADILTRCPR